MTNADKYLRDGVSGIRPLLDKCREIGAIDSGREYRIDQMLRERAKPTLTEDERVILRNIKSIHNVIGRNRDGNIQLMCKEPRVKDCIWHINLSCYNHLFQFIKERRRIRDKGVTK